MSTQFNFTYDQGVSYNQMLGMEIAGQAWSHYLQDNTTINIHIASSSDLPAGVIGGALPAMKSRVSYENVRNALFNNRTSSLDHTASQHLSQDWRQAVEFDWVTEADEAISDQDNRQRLLRRLNMTNANAKALGIATNGSALDGFILMGKAAPWSYKFTGTTASTKLDFVSTAMHEIGHILGFVSGLDNPGELRSAWQAFQSNRMAEYEQKLWNRANSGTVLDLFRFNAERTSANPDFSYGNFGGWKKFSVDDGATALGYFANGDSINDGGDGYQASHWQSSEWYQANSVMAPALGRGRRQSIGWVDVQAMDAIGWDVRNDYAVSWGTLRDRAKAAMAAKLNTSIEWMEANKSQTVSSLRQSREADVTQMIKKSVIYEWGVDGGGWWQKVKQIFQQRALFSKIDLGAAQPLTNVTSNRSSSATTPAYPELTVQWEKSNDNAQSTIEQNGVTVQATSVQLVQVQNSEFDLNTPKAFSISVGQIAKQPGLDNQIDWGIPGDGYWDNQI
ncbi:NF038122 family metalloprotease [filamentous cyanobacterium LEGE 11480]|uniref:NF038122 family metalloprotease n=1 Tax=Romeriopsis navalis LEGE 11480 TaxID=2777977 RepID=A0A928VMI0_9CYAN|nr:NF038122 family metalloprotease [Romeriopsis navalis]MBE9031281.1 NF038122 family metalloprotease [Romeriopsis navalis LEGE 11480]